MSNYNSILQSNNIDLQTVLQALQTKATGGKDPFATTSLFTYTIDAISGAQYGFAKNSNGYYESQNKGRDNSYAICRVNLIVTSTCDITFDVINYAESNYDYAIFGNLDSALALSNSADSSVKENFKGRQSASVVNVTYNGVAVGNHYIDIKFRKDSSANAYNDSVQFKIQEQKGGLSQETINKILAADTDLVAENIKNGVNIFGVTGTLVEGDGSAEDAMISRTISGNYTNNRVSVIGYNAFEGCQTLTSVNFPKCTTISSRAFFNCSNLTSISFPVCTIMSYNAFAWCYRLTTADFPACTTIGPNAFASCRSLTTASFPVCTTINSNAFSQCSNLTTINFPVCTTIGSDAFTSCYKLTTADFPGCTTIGSDAFDCCSNLTTINFPVCTTINSNAFRRCSKLTTISFPACTTIGVSAFQACYNLKSLYLTNSAACTTLSNSNAFASTPIGGYSKYAGTYGSIYVPASLLTTYQTATNWTYFSSRFAAIENSPDWDGTYGNQSNGDSSGGGDSGGNDGGGHSGGGGSN